LWGKTSKKQALTMLQMLIKFWRASKGFPTYNTYFYLSLGFLQNSITGSPIKRIHGNDNNIVQGDGASTTSCDIGPHSGDEFSLDEVRHRLHGQLDIQPISQPQSSTHGIHPNTTWFNRDGEGQETPPPQAHTTTGMGKSNSSGTGSEGGGAHSEEDAGRHQIVRHPHQR